jgi:hypothetical protein
MAIKPESQFIKSIHKHIDHGVYSMKNHNAYVAGVPDCWYSGTKNDLWIEYKYKPVDKVTSWVTPALSAQQLHWITCRQIEGRKVWVIVGIKGGGVLFDNVHEMSVGISAENFMVRLVTRKEIALHISAHCQESPNGSRTLISST